MEHSANLKEIAPALVKAQAAIKGAIKDATNPHFKSKYADLSSVVEAVKPGLAANGLMFMQDVADAEDGPTIQTMLLHSSGEWVKSSPLKIPASKHDAQGYGSAITYGRRYSLQAICGVPAEDDDGNAAAKAAPPARTAISPTDGSLDALTASEKLKAKEIADGIVSEWNQGNEFTAYEAYYEAGLTNEMMLGIWELLRPHSAIRNKLKAMHKAPPVQKEPA